MNSAPSNSFSRPLALIFVLMIAGAAALWLRPTAPPNVSVAAHLFLNTPELEPTTTFEVRFDETMIAPESVGLESTPSPLEIQPQLPGKFTWLSRRSGVFTPSEPPKLNATYTVSLRSDLVTADGKPLKARLRERFTTPPFGFTCQGGYGLNSSNATSVPSFSLTFNADVATNAIPSYIRFVNATGKSVPVNVTFGQKRRSGPNRNYEDNEATWADRFARNHADAPEPVDLRKRSQPDQFIPAPNRLWLIPLRPLPAGKGWKLVVERGLPSADGQLQTLEAEVFPVGDVQPLQVTEIRAVNQLNSGREVRIVFNKELSRELLGTNALDWFTVTPPVENLELHQNAWGGINVSLAGDFGLGTNYTVTVRAGLPTQNDFKLEQPVTEEVVFEPLAPQVYLPTYTGDQLAGGRREFEFLTLNCPDATINVKRLAAETLIHALRGYRSYSRGSWNREGNHALDYNVIPGVTVFSTTFQGLGPQTPIDQVARHTLKWDELLGQRHLGTALVQVQQGNPDSRSHDATVAQALVQVTDLGLLWKKTEREIMVWCFSYATGEPVPGATITLASDENEPLTNGITDGEGFVKFPNQEPGRWLLAEKGPDLHAMELSSSSLSWMQSRLPYEYWSSRGETDDGALQGLLFTERKAYHPGDTAFVKAIVREFHDGHPTLPQPRVMQLTCTDPQEVEVFSTNLTLSAMGSLDAAIPLPVAPPGTYQVHLFETNRESFETQFTVADYEPNAFELKVAAKSAYAADEPVEIPVTASYYMGKSLSNARLRWVADTADETFAPEGFDDFTFGAHRWDYGDDDSTSSAMTLQGEAAFDANGKLTLSPDVPLNPRFPQPRHVALLVETTDANQQTVSEQTEFVRHASAFYLGLRQSAQLRQGGAPLPVEVVAVNSDGTPHREPVPVHLTLKKIEYNTVRVQGAGNSVSFRNQREDKIVFETNATTLALTNLGTKWDLAPGGEPAAVQSSEPGEHLLEVSAKDSAGYDVFTALSFYVFANGEATWFRRSDVNLELVPDQKSYHSGGTARVLVKTPVSGPALVTVERERVLRHFQVQLEGNAPTIEIPLEDSDAPNVFVSVMMLRGADKTPRQSRLPDYRYGYCVLNVESRATTLDVSVSAAHTDYQPGQTVDVSVQINDGFGAPSPDAEVTLYAVDEGVLSLTGYERPNPGTVFYAKHALGVTTGISIDQVEPENPDDVHFENKGFVIGGGGRTDTRKNFVACAFWNATLHTDAAGRITAQFKAPDNLTRFRIIAVAHTAKQQFGSGESGFNINKPLMLEPSLPRFANVGDEAVLRALVHNQSKSAGEVRVELTLDENAISLSPSDGERAGVRGSSRAVTLAAGASSYVEFPVRLTAAGTAKWTWRAKFVDPANGNFADAVESTLSVGYPQPLLRETHLARCDAGSTDLLAAANPQLLEGRGTIHVRVANTRLVELSEAVSHLLHYPYGCAEQTSSSLLPWVLLDDFPGVLPPSHPGAPNRDRALQIGFTRLMNMQDARGGLAYWPGGQPMLWASAYGGFVLALADARGLPVPQRPLNRLMDYLTTSLNGLESMRGNEDLSDQCLALLALAIADRPQPAYYEVMFRKRDELSAESRALLALAILQANGSTNMATELLDAKAPSREATPTWFGCPERESAIRLAALCRLNPGDPQIDKTVAELMRRQQAGRWQTTQGNAWALFALTEYAKLVEGARGNASAVVAFNGSTNAVTLTADHIVADLEFTLQTNSAPQLLLNNTADGRIYSTVTLETRSTQTELPRQDRGFSIARRYELLGADGMLREFKDARVGDTVVITLTLDVHQHSHFVAVDDALPAVFEEVNPAFKSQATRADPLAQDWFSDYQEIHGDRVQFFRDHLPAGRYVITHLARVRTQGEATAPGAKVEEMYHPERFGFSGTEHVSTQAMEH